MDPNQAQTVAYNQNPPQTNPQQIPQRKFPKWLKIIGIIFGVIALFVIVVFLVVNLSTAEPLKVSDQFVQDIQNKDVSSADSLIADNFSRQDLQSFISTMPSFDKQNVIDKKISSSTDTGTIAVFIYKLNLSSGSDLYLKVEVKKKDNSWKILNLRSSPTPLDATVE